MKYKASMPYFATTAICVLALPTLAYAEYHSKTNEMLEGNIASPTSDETHAPSTSLITEIVVTARRRSEDASKTPIAVTALGAEQLRAVNVAKVTDLTSVVPGVNLFTVGGSQNVVFSIRGMSRGTLGFQQPAVTSYINDAPLPSVGSNISTYDLQSVQVLKGAQGTLFGRNSEAGAVLLNTQAPT